MIQITGVYKLLKLRCIISYHHQLRSSKHRYLILRKFIHKSYLNFNSSLIILMKMPTAVVTVRWLQPVRYRGMEETVSRSRVRQRGHLSVGEEVRVRYKRSYYKAEIIDNGGKLRKSTDNKCNLSKSNLDLKIIPDLISKRYIHSICCHFIAN